ncbi:CPBP family intramembrane glutamic endopeptidase [Clostridium sp. Marseille-P3244]|uniref:CPBP family intramembrane glutamic endopeptidase n=1 Tax=Clostridium sp. Marseille-P3244 TaxID=1871020 RepID=UPI000930C413|nr:CPBP family intramembrane glutamic endopeptidase [Clostridium sp. Marseille-P3244]
MKKARNYGIAAVVFILMIVLLNGSAVVLSAGIGIVGAVLGGYEGINLVYDFMMNNMNLLTGLAYIIPGTVFFLWYYFAFVEKQGISVFLRSHTRRLTPASFGWQILLVFSVQHATTLVMRAIAAIAPPAIDNYSQMIESSGVSQYSLMWAISTLILPPLVEEIVFRGLILKYLERAGACFIVANLIQALLFGIFHMNIVQGIYTCLLGFLLGYMAYRYDSILAPMITHALFNLFGTLIVDLENRFLPDFAIGLLVLISVPLLVGTLLMIHFRIGERKREKRQVQ